jgi:hypothetical protein
MKSSGFIFCTCLVHKNLHKNLAQFIKYPNFTKKQPSFNMPFIKIAYDVIKSEWVGGEKEKP